VTAGAPILIAYDGSEGAARAVAEAGRVFGPGRRAVVATVWCSLATLAPSALSGLPPGVAQASLDQLDAAAEREAAAQAEAGAEAAREAGFDAQAVAHREDGAGWAGTCALADQLDAAAIVVGSRGLSGVKSALLGSFSRGVVHNARRPVLVVPPDEE
jgi:nucleotide-binding universal stress UspA family protein